VSNNRINIHNIARDASVSIATVSRVINGHSSVSPEVRKRVQDTIQRLAYRPNIIARSLRTQQSGSIGVVVPNISNAYFSDAVRAFQDEVEGAGYTTFIVNTDGKIDREQAALRTLQERRVDGVVLVSAAGKSTPALLDLLRASTPVVAMDRRIDHPAIDHVLMDVRRGTMEAVLHLVGQGRRRIAFLAGPAGLSTAKEKLAGYRDGLRKSGIVFDKSLVFPGDYTFAGGEAQSAEIIRRRPRPNAIVVANNLMALGAMRTLLRASLDIPREIAFFGVDDADWSDTIKPAVSVVAQPTAAMGRETARLFLRRKENGDAAKSGEIVVLPTSLVLRESTEGAA
jgi:LacI family transcriptional regulator